MKVADHYRLTSGGVFGYCRKPTFCHYEEGTGHLIMKGQSYFNTLIRKEGTKETIKICIPCAAKEYKDETKPTKKKTKEKEGNEMKYRVYMTVELRTATVEGKKSEVKEFAETAFYQTLKDLNMNPDIHTFRTVREQENV